LKYIARRKKKLDREKSSSANHSYVIILQLNISKGIVASK